MADFLFRFEEGTLPPVVVLATATIVALLGFGILYRVLTVGL